MRHPKSTIILTSNYDVEKGSWTLIIMICFINLPRILHGKSKGNHDVYKNIVDSSIEIRTRRFPNRNKSRFFNLCGGTLGTATTTDLLYHPRMIGVGDCGEISVMKIDRGTEVLKENLPQRHFVHHKSHMTGPGFEPGPPRREAND
jgi:hypothetical protein